MKQDAGGQRAALICFRESLPKRNVSKEGKDGHATVWLAGESGESDGMAAAILTGGDPRDYAPRNT